MDKYDIARKICDARRAKNLSQKELGDLLGVSNKAVSKWENGDSVPKTETLIKLGEVLGLDVSELIGISNCADSQSDEKIRSLTVENDLLKSELATAKKKKRRNLIVAFSVCVVCIVAVIASSVIIGNFGKNGKINGIGEQGRKISFADNEFIPADDLTAYAFSGSRLTDDLDLNKYADFSDGKSTQRIAVSCNSHYPIIAVSSLGKKYYYINKDSFANLQMTPDKIGSYTLSDESAADTDYSEYTSRDDFRFINIDPNGDFGTALSNTAFHKSAECKEAVDKKIVERYMSNNSLKLRADVNDGSLNMIDIYELELGEFFSDDDKNIYYYDYSTGNAYKADKGVNGFVG